MFGRIRAQLSTFKKVMPKSYRKGGRPIGLCAKRRLLAESLEPRHLMAAYINEVHFSPLFGDATKHQYVELRGDSLSSMSAGTYLVVIGSADGVNELGDIHTIFNLSNQAFGSNGMLVLTQSGSNFSIDPAARTLTGTDGFIGIPGSVYSADNGFGGMPNKQIRTGSNTFLLIQSAVAPLLSNDIDSNDDGTPDGAYLNWTILDGFTVFPWGESVWPQKAYAPIVFQEDGVGAGMPGATLVRTEELAYVGRIGQSTGYSANDWLAGNTTESGTNSFIFQLEDGIFGVPRPRAYAGRFLDHIGGPNWVGSISGSVFVDLNSDGIQQAGEAPIVGARVVADLSNDGVPNLYSETIEPNNYLANRVLTNISSNATITTAGTDNLPINFDVTAVQKFGAPAGQHIFSHVGIGFFGESRRLRTDFYRPARSISIDVIGDSNSRPTYGRLEIFNAANVSLGFVRTGGLLQNQTQRLTMTSSSDEIAWAVAYSESSYLNSSPFGMLDSLSFTLAEQSTVTDSNGNYFLQPMTPGDYSLRVATPVNYDVVFPSSGTHSIRINKYESYGGRNFGVRGNLPPVVNDQTFNVSEENVGGSVVATLQFDKGYPSQVLTAAITAGDPTGLFAVNPTTGGITLNRSELNFESTKKYQLTVKFTDSVNSALSDSANIELVIVDANEPPVVNADSKSVAENSPVGTSIATMTATDPDSGVAGQFTWSIVEGNTGSAFAIDANTGEVRVNDASKVDFETNRVFNLKVRATDRGTPVKFGEAILQISLTNVNEAPVLLVQPLSIKENSLVGTLLGTINAVDPDANESLVWEVTGGSGATLFQIGADAQVKVATGANLDFEQTKDYDLVVKVTDAGTLSDTRTFSIVVENVNDAPILTAPATITLKEDAVAGSVVGSVSATDQDAGQLIAFGLSGPAAGKFVVDASTGEIKVANGATFDFETAPTLSVTVMVTDNGVPAQSASSVITVQVTNVNEAPSIQSTSFEVAENSAPGTIVGSILGSDPDAGDNVTYGIVQQTVSWLAIDAATGALTVATGATIDFETLKLNSVTVRVTDAGGLQSERVVQISALDRNDAPTLMNPLPNANATALNLFTYTVPANTFVDQDAGDSLRFSMTNGAGFPLPSWLSFNATTRVLSGTPTMNDGGSVELRVTAVDAAGAPTSARFTVTVAASQFSWHNTSRPMDVNGDNLVSPVDALIVINYLNSGLSRAVAPGSNPMRGFLDTNKDNVISPTDALLIINALNRRAGGEGESSLGSQIDSSRFDWDFFDALEDRKRQEELVELLAGGRSAGQVIGI